MYVGFVDIKTARGIPLEVMFLRHLLQCLLHRAAAEIKVCAEFSLAETFAAFELAHQDLMCENLTNQVLVRDKRVFPIGAVNEFLSGQSHSPTNPLRKLPKYSNIIMAHFVMFCQSD